MAVFTKLLKEDIENFISEYSIGDLDSFEEIVDGIENSNFKIYCDNQPYILTIFEKRVTEQELPFFINLKYDNKNGYCKTVGQVDKGLIGFAVPINNKKLGIEASLSSIFNSIDFLPEHEPIIYANLTSYSLLIERYINQIFDDIQNYHQISS